MDRQEWTDKDVHQAMTKYLNQHFLSLSIDNNHPIYILCIRQALLVCSVEINVLCKTQNFVRDK